MESLPATTLLNFRADTLDVVRKTCNLHKPGEMSAAIDILEAWVKQQKHFLKKDFDRGYLERKIIGCKGSVERAKERFDKICTSRTLMPQYFGDFDIRNDFKLFHSVISGPHSELNQDNQRILMLKCAEQKFESTVSLEICKLLILCTEIFTALDYANGYIMFIDCININWMELISKLNINVLRQGIAIILGGYQAKLSGIHVLTNSNLVDMLLSIVKTLVSAKLASRIWTHTTLETVYEYIPRDMLPVEYGGKQIPLSVLHVFFTEQWCDIVSSREQREFVREMCTARTDESLRQKDTFNDMYNGIPGTFRTLNLD